MANDKKKAEPEWDDRTLDLLAATSNTTSAAPEREPSLDEPEPKKAPLVTEIVDTKDVKEALPETKLSDFQDAAPLKGEMVRATVPGMQGMTVPQQPAPMAAAYDDPVAVYLNGNLFEQLQRVAKLMCKAGLVPAHLRGDGHLSDCFLVAAQAFRWRLDPFAVAQATYVVQGRLGYEGKLIAAVVNSRVKKALVYDYFGDEGTDGRGVIVKATRADEDFERTIKGTVGSWKTTNEKWKTMPDQMLAYRGAREWARRHDPGLVLGIAAEDELEPEPATPAISGESTNDTIKRLAREHAVAAG